MPPPRPRAGASVDYSSKHYWSSRFEHEKTFEWLVSSSVLAPHIIEALDDLENGSDVKIIHIGCGNSELSLDLRQLVDERPTASNIAIINVDYAAPALEGMQAAELARFGSTQMRWEVLDLLDWTVTSGLLPKQEYAVVVDKSCADAIACGQDIGTSLLGDGTVVAHPMEVLAMHIAALVLPGSIWLAVSYSSSRFDFVSSSEGPGSCAREFWQLERTEHILAPTEAKINVYAPEVYHTLFVLKRTAKSLHIDN